MSAHTPGPWQIDWNVSRLDIFRSEMGTLVASIRRSAISPELDVVAIADARLIAAAPELLEALEETLNAGIGWYDDARGLDPEALEWVQKARRAIAKAKGEA